ncbi:MAG TPA: methylmalonyl-CoA epimerase [Burkholderiales bacterium]|nr:methylmalonyl-CoA epimerase [Burkholderiales bacterium]
MFSGLSHVSIVVPDLAQAAKQLEERYGLQVGAVQTNEAQGVRLAYIDLGNAKIELMEPARAGSPVSKFLERNPGGGIHHFCLEVDDVDAAGRAMTRKGVKVLGERETQRNVHGARIAFVHPRDFLGALVEIEERHVG